jgi:hypothetical protein
MTNTGRHDSRLVDLYGDWQSGEASTPKHLILVDDEYLITDVELRTKDLEVFWCNT